MDHPAHPGFTVGDVFRGKDRADFFRQIEQIDEQAPQQNHGFRALMDNEIKEFDRPVRDVTRLVAIKVVAIVIVPIISIKGIAGGAAVHGHVKGIGEEVVVPDGIFQASPRHFDGPTIADEVVIQVIDPVGTFHQDAYRVFAECVVADLEVVDFLQQ